MKTASLVLGIIGGVIAILYSLVLILGGSFLLNAGFWESAYEEWSDPSGEWNGDDWQVEGEWNNGDGEYYYHIDIPDDVPEWVFTDAISMGGTIVIGGGILAAVGGILGLVGGCIAKKKNVAAGVLMIVAAVISIVALFNFVSMVLLILGGIFALVKERHRPAAQPAQAYPYPPYPPYQTYPPQQPAPPASEKLPEPPQEQ